MKRTLVAAALLVYASTLFAGSWYSIDGFTVIVDDSIVIEEDGAESQFIGFAFAGDEESTVAGWLAESDDDFLPNHDMLIVGAISIIRSLQFDADDRIESFEINEYTTPAGVTGQWISLFSTTGFHDAFMIPLDTPGGLFSAMILVPQDQGGDGRAELDRLLDSLTVRIERAAG